MPRKPPRPTHSPLTDTEVRTLDVLVRRGARTLAPAECNKLISLFQHHVGDLQQARRSVTGMRADRGAYRRRAEAAEAALAEAQQHIEAAKSWARMTQRLGTSDEAGLAQAVLLKLGVPFEEAAAPQKASQP